MNGSILKSHFCFLIIFSAAAVGSENNSELLNLTNEAKAALNNPAKIPNTAKKIQTFFSSEENKALINSHSQDVETLARLQTRLITYTRLAKDLGDSQCSLDPTKKSKKGQEILASSLNVPTLQCSEIGADFLQEHKNISTLIDEMKMIVEKSYSGAYTIDENGDLKFPWQINKADQEKHHWKFTLPVVSGESGIIAGEPPSAFDPYSLATSRKLADELYKQSLKDTFKTYLYLQTAYGNEKINPQKIARSFCKEKVSFFSRIAGQKKATYCPPSIEKFAIKEATKSNAKEHPKSYEDGAKDLTTQVTKINKIVERIQKNSQIEYVYQGKSDVKYVKSASFKDKQQAMQDYSDYKKLHAEMVASGPGLFTATDELSDALGLRPLNAENFIKPHPAISKSQFKRAVNEARGHTFAHGQELLSIYHSKDPVEDQIKNFLQLNPAAASKVLLNRPEFAKTVCRGLKGISVEEMNDRQLRLVATWGGVIVGGAISFTGVGAIPMAIVGTIAAAPDLVLSYEHFEEASNERDAAFAERNGDRAKLETDKYKTAKNELITAGALTGAGILFDIHQVMKAGKVSEQYLFNRPIFNRFSVDPSVERLQTLGYSEEIAQKIIKDEPEISSVLAKGKIPREIRNRFQYRRNKKPTIQPAVVYRGLAIDPEKFDPKFIPNFWANGNEIFVTPEIKEALDWGSLPDRVSESIVTGTNKRGKITIVEYEIPDYLIYRGRHQDIIYTDDIKKQASFIKRVGEMSIEDARLKDPTKITWEP